MIKISAASASPNTDRIKQGKSNVVTIKGVNIGTVDDWIVMIYK